MVKGTVVFENKALEDLVLLRSDGSPVYNVAAVVDDHDMGITHVVRGDDHLSNTAKQILIFKALGWALPEYAHLPMIHGPDGAKLSKRHGAQAVHEFRDMGYLPEAMRNYLTRQGWGHGDDEIFSDDQAIAWFDVVDVGRAPSRLDWAKLGHVNNHYIRLADDARLLALTSEIHESRGLKIGERQREALLRTIPLVKEGAKTLLELADLTVFALRERPVPLDDKAKGLLDAETRDRLGRLATRLADEPEWLAPAMSAALRSFAEGEGVGLGKFAQPLRAALSGGSPAPDLASTLEALGREESLGRLQDALSQVQ
jgi:glutamyl-tRNA synthetase